LTKYNQAKTKQKTKSISEKALRPKCLLGEFIFAELFCNNASEGLMEAKREDILLYLTCRRV
jgi:hypothetical protein